jgi:hypothetical protein
MVCPVAQRRGCDSKYVHSSVTGTLKVVLGLFSNDMNTQHTCGTASASRTCTKPESKLSATASTIKCTDSGC